YLQKDSAGRRRGVIGLLRTQPDAVVLASADRLLAGRAGQRLAGLELLRLLVEERRALPECLARGEAYRAGRGDLGDREREPLAVALRPDQPVPTLDDALGLMDPSRLTPITPPRKRKVRFMTPATVACLRALDDLVHEHRDAVVK